MAASARPACEKAPARDKRTSKKAVVFSDRDLQRQIQALQKQVLFLTSKLTQLLAKQVSDQKHSKTRPTLNRGRPSPQLKTGGGVECPVTKWLSVKRFTVSRKNMPPVKALAYGVVDGRYYLKLPKGQVTLLSKVTRLSYKGVHLTSKKTMRSVISGESPLRLPETKKVVTSRVSGKRPTTTRPNVRAEAPAQLERCEPDVTNNGTKVQARWPEALKPELPMVEVLSHRGQQHGLLHVVVRSDAHYFCYLEHPDVELSTDLLSRRVEVEPSKLKDGIVWEYDWEEALVRKSSHPGFWV